MFNFIKNLFRRHVTFGDDTKSFVSVMNTAVRHPQKSDELFCGRIREIDFTKRIVCIQLIINRVCSDQLRYIPFDKIVTISRMNDSRLRMWIETED